MKKKLGHQKQENVFIKPGKQITSKGGNFPSMIKRFWTGRALL